MKLRILTDKPQAQDNDAEWHVLEFPRPECSPILAVLAAHSTTTVPRITISRAANLVGNQRAAVSTAISHVRASLSAACKVGRYDLIPRYDHSNDGYRLCIDRNDIDYFALEDSAKESLLAWDADKLNDADASARRALNYLPGELGGPLASNIPELRPLRDNVLRWRDIAGSVIVNAQAEKNPDSAVEIGWKYISLGSRYERLWMAQVRALYLAGSHEALAAVLDGRDDRVPKSIRTLLAEQVAKYERDGALRPRVLSPYRTQDRQSGVEALGEVDQAELVDEAVDAAQANSTGKFHFFTLSGASSSGKDTLVHYALDRTDAAAKFEILRKFTTRPARTGEPDYIRCVNRVKFEELTRSGTIMWPYEKRGKLYGFDKNQWMEAIARRVPILAIYTEIDDVPRITAELRQGGLKVTNILIRADLQTCRDRSWLRGFSKDEAMLRIDSAFDDNRRMLGRPHLLQEYTIIDYSNDRDVNSAVTEFLSIMHDALAV